MNALRDNGHKLDQSNHFSYKSSQINFFSGNCKQFQQNVNTNLNFPLLTAQHSTWTKNFLCII